jgi:DNA mismatch repair protein MutS
VPTPIRRQYLELKQRYPDTILFFRLGDFYETFDDDARLVAQELSITLTSKPMGKDLRVPLAGVPHHSIDGHVAKLVARGHRVAVCEQMADPADVKGIVPREVVRVVTAGTVTADNSLDATAPNYLAALAFRQGKAGVALADITTGEVRLASGDEATRELIRSAPAELIVEDEADVPDGVSASLRRQPQMSDLAVEAELARQFGEHAREGLVGSDAEAAALARILAYLKETYPAALGALQRVRTVTSGDTLALDPRTLRNLDVFPVDGRHSLFSVLNATRSAMGARLLRAWLTRPLRSPERLAERHDGVAWALHHPIETEQAHAILRSIPDIGRLAGKVGARSAGPRDLHGLRAGLRATLDLGAQLNRHSPPPLLAAGLRSLASAAEPLLSLDAALDDDPPATFDEGGVVRPGFSPEIDSLRALTRDARGFILGLERLERERTGIRSLKVGHNRVFGYYIEISSANAGAVPDHYQRRQTLVGAERYVTEELKEHESRLVGARDRLVELEKQAFSQLVETLAAGIAALQAVAEAVATIDLVLALGTVASRQGYVRPVFNDGDHLRLAGARHPVVEAALGPGRFVPNECVFDDDCQVILLTGPNMSGKSTYLRQVALIALMAQSGSFVPAVEADLPLFDRIFTRIGAQDDLAAGQSTFMVEMVETAQILHQATPQSLVVLDEVGRGTSTFDGMAIARAVVEFLHNRKEISARTLFATHYHELTSLADVLPRVRNAHVAVHEEGTEVVFEHRIVPGPSDRSYGIHVARLAGLPAAVVSRAEHLLGEFEANGHHMAMDGASPAVVQPALFGGPSPVETALAGIDVDGLTPLEAIQKLYELRALLPALARHSR